MSWTDIIILVIVPGCSAYFGTYLKKKGENYATKEDIGLITKLTEEVKSDLARIGNVESKRFELLHDAILEALRLIDCYYSYKISPSVDTPVITKQDAKTEEFRDCHNRLILSCRNPEIVQLFMKIMFEKLTVPELMQQLNVFRILARKELEFGSQIELDENKCWFSHTISPPEKNLGLNL